MWSCWTGSHEMEGKDRFCPLWTIMVFPFHSHAGCGTAMVSLELTRMIAIAILGSVSDTACSCLQQQKNKQKKRTCDRFPRWWAESTFTHPSSVCDAVKRAQMVMRQAYIYILFLWGVGLGGGGENGPKTLFSLADAMTIKFQKCEFDCLYS